MNIMDPLFENIRDDPNTRERTKAREGRRDWIKHFCIEEPHPSFDEERIKRQKTPSFALSCGKQGFVVPFNSDFSIPTDIPFRPYILEVDRPRDIRQFSLKIVESHTGDRKNYEAGNHKNQCEFYENALRVRK